MTGLIMAASIYATTMRVTAIDNAKDIVTMETATGHIFEMEGTEDYMIGDYVSLVMDDNGTPGITDDIIVSAQYSGWTDLFEIE